MRALIAWKEGYATDYDMCLCVVGSDGCFPLLFAIVITECGFAIAMVVTVFAVFGSDGCAEPMVATF